MIQKNRLKISGRDSFHLLVANLMLQKNCLKTSNRNSFHLLVANLMFGNSSKYETITIILQFAINATRR